MESILLIAGVYLAMGLLFGVFFAAKGVKLLDPVAEGSPLTFRLLVMPAATALWPFLLVKILKKKSGATG